ncbi:hypothetical protein GY45DRAFT_400247 [Cubamyces sp. BRFM 1775]|nr:hypothetical protein GY45DRAFT_400247 [Cubamyces sp. BRFM 1775]
MMASYRSTLARSVMTRMPTRTPLSNIFWNRGTLLLPLRTVVLAFSGQRYVLAAYSIRVEVPKAWNKLRNVTRKRTSSWMIRETSTEIS